MKHNFTLQFITSLHIHLTGRHWGRIQYLNSMERLILVFVNVAVLRGVSKIHFL
jgi:hypothetical protein